mgnify:CR=1 FL=1
MLLSTMSYMEIHREIVNDFRDLYAAIMKEFAEFQKKLDSYETDHKLKDPEDYINNPEAYIRGL